MVKLQHIIGNNILSPVQVQHHTAGVGGPYVPLSVHKHWSTRKVPRRQCVWQVQVVRFS